MSIRENIDPESRWAKSSGRIDRSDQREKSYNTKRRARTSNRVRTISNGFLNRAIPLLARRLFADNNREIPKVRPPEVVFFLALVQTVSEPDAPDNI